MFLATLLVLFSLAPRFSYCCHLCLLWAVSELAAWALLMCLLSDVKKMRMFFHGGVVFSATLLTPV